MKKITLLFAMLFCFASYGQVETNITQNLVSYLNGIPEWNNTTYGCCPLDPSNDVEQDENLCVEQIYVVDLSLIGVDELFINKRVEMRNGTLKVINGTVVFDDTQGGEFVTYEFGDCVSGFVFNENNDLGRVFFTVQDYLDAQEVLSVQSIEQSISNNVLPGDYNFTLYNILGQNLKSGLTNNYTFESLTTDLKQGIYLINFESKSVRHTVKYIKK